MADADVTAMYAAPPSIGASATAPAWSPDLSAPEPAYDAPDAYADAFAVAASPPTPPTSSTDVTTAVPAYDPPPAPTIEAYPDAWQQTSLDVAAPTSADGADDGSRTTQWSGDASAAQVHGQMEAEAAGVALGAVGGLPGFGAAGAGVSGWDGRAHDGAAPTPGGRSEGGDSAAPPPRAWNLEYAPIPGPVDRESFFEAQRRYRRQTWRQTLACAVAAVVAGVPLSLILTPFVYFLSGMFFWLVDLALPVPMRVWDGYRWVGGVMMRVVEDIAKRDSANLEPGETLRTGIPWSLIFTAAAVWLIPGIIAMLLIWPALRALLKHGGVGGVLLAVAARPPNPQDLEERQLVNVIEEMAIAAGLPAPQVALIDAPVANAAAVGTGPEDVTILVSRPLLDELNRDETQAVLGHLVASVGNGDLSAALSIVAIFQTFGFASALVRAPASGVARRTVWRVLRLALFRRARRDEAHAVAQLLSRPVLDDEADDDFTRAMELPEEVQPRPGVPLQLVLYAPITFIAWFILATIAGLPGPLVRLGLIAIVGVALAIIWYQRVYFVWVTRTILKSFKVLFMLPYFLGVFMPQLLMSFTISFLLEPMVALVWRTRRYLADASAVQLTRNPQALAEGLSDLVARGATVPGGAWASPFFVVGGQVSQQYENAKLLAEVERRLEAERAARGFEQMDGTQRRIAEAQLQIEVRRAIAMEHYGTGAGGVSTPEHAATGRASASGTTFSGDVHGVARMHPPLSKRLDRLRAYGASLGLAQPGAAARQQGGRRRRILAPGTPWYMLPVVIVLLLLLPVLMTVAIALLTAISLAATGILMLAAYGVLAVLTPV